MSTEALRSIPREPEDHPCTGNDGFTAGAVTRRYRVQEERTLFVIKAHDRSRLLWDSFPATKTFVRDDLAFFRTLAEAGVVSIVQGADGQWRARQMIFELRLR